jgi:hypothetical protein
MGRYRGRIGWPIVVAGLLSVALASPASANTTSKPFALTMAPGVPSYTTVATEVAGGQTVSITATLTDETSTQQIGSANLFWPAGFNVIAVTPAVSPAGSASLSAKCTNLGVAAGACVQVRGLSLQPGHSATVTMTVTTPACQPPGSNFAWAIEAKQANNYSGSPGNDLFLDLPNSNINTTLDGACSLKFDTQPTDAAKNAFITASAFNPFGAPIAVGVYDTNGALITTSTAPVTNALGGNNPGNQTLAGTLTQDAAGGDASFSDLSVGAAGTGYALLASSGTLTGATSNPFNIQDQVVSCGAGSSCPPLKDGTTNGNNSEINTGSGSSSGIATESVNTNGGGQLHCTGYTSADPNSYEEFAPSDRSKQVTTTIRPLKKISGNANQILKAQQLCFGAPYQFTTASGAPAAGPQTLPDGTTGYIGLLPNCPAAGPCHNRQLDHTVPDSMSPNGFDIVLVFDVPAGLPGDPMHG